MLMDGLYNSRFVIYGVIEGKILAYSIAYIQLVKVHVYGLKHPVCVKTLLSNSYKNTYKRILPHFD